MSLSALREYEITRFHSIRRRISAIGMSHGHYILFGRCWVRARRKRVLIFVILTHWPHYFHFCSLHHFSALLAPVTCEKSDLWKMMASVFWGEQSRNWDYLTSPRMSRTSIARSKRGHLLADFSHLLVFRKLGIAIASSKSRGGAEPLYSMLPWYVWCTLITVVNLFSSLSRFSFWNNGRREKIGKRKPPHFEQPWIGDIFNSACRWNRLFNSSSAETAHPKIRWRFQWQLTMKPKNGRGSEHELLTKPKLEWVILP